MRLNPKTVSKNPCVRHPSYSPLPKKRFPPWAMGMCRMSGEKHLIVNAITGRALLRFVTLLLVAALMLVIIIMVINIGVTIIVSDALMNFTLLSSY